MTDFVDRHIVSMLKRLPKSRLVRLGTVTAYGVLDAPEQTESDATGAQIGKRAMVLTLPTDAIPLLTESSTVIVYETNLPSSTQTSYEVRDSLKPDDGLTTKWLLVPAS